MARRKGWGVSFAKVALDSVRELDAAIVCGMMPSKRKIK